MGKFLKAAGIEDPNQAPTEGIPTETRKTPRKPGKFLKAAGLDQPFTPKADLREPTLKERLWLNHVRDNNPDGNPKNPEETR